MSRARKMSPSRRLDHYAKQGGKKGLGLRKRTMTPKQRRRAHKKFHRSFL